jgi:hypothetical protein
MVPSHSRGAAGVYPVPGLRRAAITGVPCSLVRMCLLRGVYTRRVPPGTACAPEYVPRGHGYGEDTAPGEK